jgi:hypothetical protein
VKAGLTESVETRPAPWFLEWDLVNVNRLRLWNFHFRWHCHFVAEMLAHTVQGDTLFVIHG